MTTPDDSFTIAMGKTLLADTGVPHTFLADSPEEKRRINDMATLYFHLLGISPVGDFPQS